MTAIGFALFVFSILVCLTAFFFKIDPFEHPKFFGVVVVCGGGGAGYLLAGITIFLWRAMP